MDNLLNIKKKTAVSLNFLPEGKLSACLKNNALFFWSRVSELVKLRFFSSHVHLKTVEKSTVKGEDT
jgi:hypothetical protein